MRERDGLPAREVIVDGGGDVALGASLAVPAGARGVVAFAHGSGSSRHSERNAAVARALQRAGFATLLMDLLTADEERADARTGHLRFDIALLARRVVHGAAWLATQHETAALPIGLFGASTGAAAALVASLDVHAFAIVSRGGRPDLAGEALSRVTAPTLLIVGGADVPVIPLNQDAARAMPGLVEIAIVPGATHLFEEPGALEQVATLATAWFTRFAPRPPGDP